MANSNILQRSKLRKARDLIGSGHLSEAAALLERVVAAGRADADVWLMLGIIAGRRGQDARAADYLGRAHERRPGDPAVLYNLGIALRNSGALEEALDAFTKVVELQPGFSDAGACLADALTNLGRLDEAKEAFRQAIQHQPDNAELHANLGSVFQTQGLVGEAVACYRKALQLNPELPAYDSYGSALTEQGDFAGALAAYREGLRRQPGNARLRSNLLLTLNYLPDLGQEEVSREHGEWGRYHGNPQDRVLAHDNPRDPARRLRIGYVSPDFRMHSVAYYIEPLLEKHDRGSVDVYCYSLMPRPDSTTLRLRQLADHWRDIHTLTDRQVVERILADRIDILVDLAGHTAHNSLTMFARKPAPLQISYLGYPNTTGLSAMDYRLTDAVVDPAGAERYYSERLLRLPDCFLCYRPPADAPQVSALPAVSNGHVTFGSFNNLAKMNPGVIATWSEVLKSVPGSRLLIKNSSLTDEGSRRQYRQMFEANGISADRVELIGHTPTRKEHLALYGRVDIGLDTFPYNGTTTTCEALWMGVPVLTLAGNHHAGRVGESLLKCAGLAGWVARDPGQFVARAAELSSSVAGLAQLRETLRERLVHSPLCDSTVFARKVEAEYRRIWHEWCAAGTRGSP